MPGTASLPLTDRAFDEKLAACDRINPFDARHGGLAALKYSIEHIEKSEELSGLAALMGARRHPQRSDATIDRDALRGIGS